MPPRIDFKSQRLFVAHDLQEGADNALSEAHAHYLLTVLRMETGTKLLAFNGKDGEWRVEVTRENKRAGSLKVLVQTRPQTPLNDLWFLFAPIKKERMDWMVQKAVEMGAGALQPVITEHTQSPKLRTDKLEANIIEAAEQCGVLAVPCLKPLQNLAELVATWDQNRVVFWCDEQAEVATPTRILELSRDKPKAVLVGPEGGFSPAERELLLAAPFAKPIALGPRILRADTAAVAALTAVQMTVGDWR
ncbi:MAG: 16S rRNA (uracil(1498)-N(3))-methyltransferase [Rhizobiales bacterium]|nr:16S rRNA (uracil(1498)-N(3))-methyltransferase [Hyphomicrobiales bacterium]MBO6699250.1 16S rRNA (uracil(1498)-N(3))-methyltransferase [Hyphomicrobiales bacterium]MBO6736788.1 16S rRNA (uracil(1498)-N(3))-methyltransferase [Hyphomicrobiales bacterium]MBO6912138.1 16S rRNA (uracil(1498)-N(3))-methyltransferase [Hyphomicrobiales bacterium]MBO6956972.1 16S rRNA (uracil(1498)-N(3))-methyltransferase [Hyphomicrobiales bacterium]